MARVGKVDDKKVAFPVFGELSIVAEIYLITLGVDVIAPPPVSQRTLDIGVQNTPVALCIPLLHPQNHCYKSQY